MHEIQLIGDKFLDKNAIIEHGKTYTYRELKKKVIDFEVYIEKDSLVLCSFDASFESIALYIASLSGGFKCILTSQRNKD